MLEVKYMAKNKNPVRALETLLVAASLLILPQFAFAQSCKNSGNLNYIGRTSDNSRSVWLSLTQSGMFALEAAQANTQVDSFSRTRPGARLTLSPFVSNGSGGTHRLFELGAAANGGDCLVDTQNQKNGIVLPPRPPGIIRPPMGIMPPIAVLPPGGFAPTLPGRPIPPIGTLPPQGLTPGLPARPAPPIGTLPPQGLTPGLPARPAPPVGTLPPEGITPTLPGQPSLPTETLPGWTPQAVQIGNASAQQDRCAQTTTGKLGPAPCDKIVVPPEMVGVYTVPITPGRDLAPVSAWNVWSDIQISSTEDRRNGWVVDQSGGYVGIGIDRSVAQNMVVGIQLQYEKNDSESFGGFVSIDSSTVSVGPYISVLLNENWSASGLLTFGQVTSDVEIAGLGGSVDQNRTSAVLTATGQYAWGAWNLRPQASLDYNHTSAGDLRLDGTLLGSPLSVLAEVRSGWTGAFTPSLEINRVFTLQDAIVMPFTEIGAVYSFGENGGVLSNAEERAYSDWSGTVRVGARARTYSGLFVEASIGYNSLFEDDLDSLDASLYLAWSF
jgi:hypothetical protein